MAQQGGKGNPASHRMGNPKRKAARAASWARGEKRKDARRKEADRRQAHNAELVTAGAKS